MLSWLSAAGLLLGCLLPLYSGVGSGGDNSIFAGADATIVVFVLLIVGMLVVAGSVAAARPAAAGLAGGAGLIGGLTFGFLSSIVIYLVSLFSNFDEGFNSGANIGVGAGTVFLMIGAVLSLITFFVALSAPARRVARSATLNGVAIPGALAGLVCSIGLLLPPPDRHIAIKDYLNSRNAGVNIVYVGWLCTLGIAGLVGFLSRRRWGILLVAGAYVPMGWIGFTVIVNLANKPSQSDFESSGLGRVFSEDLHPLFGVGLVAMGICLLIGLFGGGGAAAVQNVMPGAWAADPFGRHEMRYWDGLQWTAHVSDRGATTTDAPRWDSSSGAVPVEAHAEPRWTAPEPGRVSPQLPQLPHLPPLPPPPPAATATSTHPDDDATIVRRPSVPHMWTLLFDDGRRHPLTGFTLVGRDPELEVGDPPNGVCLRIDDPERSVSKTHLAIGLTDGTMWIADRGSSNGTTLASPGGTPRPLSPHQRTEVSAGATVQIGDRIFQITEH